MAFAQDPMLLGELSKWCKEKDIEEKRGLLIIGVPTQTDVMFIEETVQTLKSFGRVRVRDQVLVLFWGSVNAEKLLIQLEFQQNYCLLLERKLGR